MSLSGRWGGGGGYAPSLYILWGQLPPLPPPPPPPHPPVLPRQPMQCLLRIYGMVAFWLMSSLHPPFVLCLSLQVSPTQQVAAYCTCRAWYSNCSSAANSTESTVHGFFQRLAYYRRQPQTLHGGCSVPGYSYSLSNCGVLLCDLCGDSVWRVVAHMLKHVKPMHVMSRDLYNKPICKAS